MDWKMGLRSWDSILVFAGFLVMCLSTYHALKLLNKLQQTEAKRVWRIMVSMVALFAVAYAGMFLVTFTNNFVFIARLSATVFFAGAFFVFLAVSVSTRMNAQILNYAENLERLVTERTSELNEAQKTVMRQHETLVTASKMSALGEMAGGVAHEINNPLAAIRNLCSQIQEIVDDDPLDKSLVKEFAAKAESITNRIAKIVLGLRTFSRDGGGDPWQAVNVKQLIEETLSFCRERFMSDGTEIIVDGFESDIVFEGRATEISQVLLNLLNNAHDAISSLKEKWIRLLVLEQLETVEIRVVDCGTGIPIETQKKIFQPFFTTKEVGKGTGLGLSISLGIIQSHSGAFELDPICPNTCFVIKLPKKQQATPLAVAVS